MHATRRDPTRRRPVRRDVRLRLPEPVPLREGPGTSDFYVNDVGQDTWEDIDELVAGADYGWNRREGYCVTGSVTDCAPSRFADPVHAYRHGSCRSVTGGAFVPRGVWPDPYGGSYLFADYVCGSIFRLVPGPDGGYTQETFATDLSSPVHLRFGPFGDTRALYYLDFFGGTVCRIAYGANSAPVAAFSTRPDGLDVAFDGSGSYDPDNDEISTYRWSFGDGTSTTTTEPTVTHTYPSAQPYQASLTVVDARD